MKKHNILILERYEGMLKEWIFLIIFGSYLFFATLGTSTLEFDRPDVFYEAVKALLIGYIVYQYATEKIASHLLLLVISLLIVVTWVIGFYSGDSNLLFVTLFILAARNIEFKKIGYVYLIVNVEIMIMAFVMSYLGITVNFVYQTERGIRQSFGICYPTDFAAHVLFIVLVYVLVRGIRISYVEIAILAGLAIAMYKGTFARNDVICLLLLCVMLFIYKTLYLRKINLSKWKIMKLTPYVTPILAVLMLLMSACYTTGINAFEKVNLLLSGRLSLGKQALHDYGLSILGQPVYERGNGFGTVSNAKNPYFFLDSSYMRIFVIDGLLFFCIVMVIYVLIGKKLLEKKYIIGVIVMMIVALFGFVEHHLLELFYNPMTLLLFASIPEPEQLVLDGKENKNGQT